MSERILLAVVVAATSILLVSLALYPLWSLLGAFE